MRSIWLLRLRYSLSSVVRDLPFVSAVLLVLSFGIASSTSIFTVIEQIVLNPFPYRDPARLVMLWEANPKLGEPSASRSLVAWENLAAWRNQTHSFETIEAFQQASFNLTGVGSPEHLTAARATGGYFEMLGVTASRGRLLLPSDSVSGAPPVAVLTESFARTHFAGQDLVGRKILLDGAPYTVVGVLPRYFHLPMFLEGDYEYKPNIWVPLPMVTAADPETASKSRVLLVTARLRPDVTVAQARGDLTSVANRLVEVDPKLNAGYSASLFSLKVENSGVSLTRALYVLWGAALLVLLLGCLNLASLMTVRIMNKQRDLAIMAALGAPERLLVVSLIAESLIVALPAAGLSLLGSYGGIAFVRALDPIEISGAERLHLDWHSFIYASLTFLCSVCVFAAFPAFVGSRRSFVALHSSMRQGATPSRVAARRVLVSAEVGGTLFLAIGAILLVRSYQRLRAVDPGFRPQNVLTARIVLPSSRYTTPEERRLFCERFLEQVRQIPGVESASLVNNLPLYAIQYLPFEIEGRPFTNVGNSPNSDFATVTPDYFQTMGTPLLKGRLFVPDDAQGDNSSVVILNETFVRKFFPHEDPLGAHIRNVFMTRPPGRWRLVVGIVADYRQFNLQTPARPELFWPTREFSAMTLVLRTAIDPTSLVPALRRSLAGIDKDQPIADIQTLDDLLDHSTSQKRFNMLLLSGFSGMSILLALVGVYGLISYLISSRRQDIAVRLALGGQRKHVFAALARQMVPSAGSGVVLGILLSFLAKNLISRLLFQISGWDPVTYLTSSFVLLSLAAITCALPAWQAARLDPASVLREG